MLIRRVPGGVVARLVLALLPGLVPGAASADFFDLYVAPGESRLELASGQLDLVLAPGWTASLAVQPQTGVPGTVPGSLPGGGASDGLETSLSGTVMAQIDSLPSQLNLNPTATEFAAGSSGVWAPASGGGGGVGLANAAFRVEDALLGIDFLGALRGVEGSMQSSTVPTPDGPHAWTVTGTLDLMLTGGVLDYDSVIPGVSGSGPLLTGGPPIASAVITNGRYEIVDGVGRMSLPFTTDPFVLFSDQIGGALPVSFTATLGGTLVAYTELPEPGTTTGLLFGVAALGIIAHRRRRTRGRAPVVPWTRATLQGGVLALLLLGLLNSNCTSERPQIGGDLCAESGVTWGASFAGAEQCGDVRVDVDGDGTPEGQVDDCATPGSEMAPGILATTTVAGPGGNAVAEMSVDQTNNTSSVVCRYDLAATLATGSAQCTGTFRRRVTASFDDTYADEDSVGGFNVAARKVALGPGAADTFEAQVVVQCPGMADVSVPLTAATQEISVTADGSGPGTTVCTVVGEITESETAAGGETLHELLIEISECALDNLCTYDRDCSTGLHCVEGQCSDGSVGSPCDVTKHCSAASPICFTDGLCRAEGELGESCDIDRHCVAGLVCSEGTCIDPEAPTFVIEQVAVTPALNLLGGTRPRFTPGIDLAAVAETSEPMGLIRVTTVACNATLVSDCNPQDATPAPPASSWSVDMADYAVGPFFYTVDISAFDPSFLYQDTHAVNFEVHPEDGAGITCTKSYDGVSGDLSLGFTTSPPPPATPGQVSDATFRLYQRTDAGGWAPDESDPQHSDSALQNPTVLTPVDDGEYQVIFTGLVDAVTPFQASLRIDTLGGPNDVCTLVP